MGGEGAKSPSSSSARRGACHRFRTLQRIYELTPDSKAVRNIALALLVGNIVTALLFVVFFFKYIGIALVIGDSLPLANSTSLLAHNILADGHFTRAVIVDGWYGNEIAQIRSDFANTYQTAVQMGFFKGVIVFFDSDVSNVVESALNASQVATLRANYRSNLAALIETISPHAKVGVAGPGLMSDGNYPRMIELFGENKTQMLNDYAAMNQEVCAATGAVYIDIRDAYLQSLHAGLDPTSYLDGEHPNGIGQSIAGSMFAAVFDQWWAEEEKI